jgi:hypothetical protein
MDRVHGVVDRRRGQVHGGLAVARTRGAVAPVYGVTGARRGGRGG